MEVILQNHSSYPGIDQRSPQQPRPADSAACDEKLAVVLRDQAEAGIDVVTSGRPDPIAQLAAALDGVRLGDRVRLFDTGQPFCQPIITGPVRRTRPIFRDDFLRASSASALLVKPVLPGPYTLARLSRRESGPYAAMTALAEAFSEVLAAEVHDLQQAGAGYIQIEEPAILSYPSDIRLLRTLLEPLWNARGTAELMVATYFGDAEPLYAQLNSLPADILALDCIASGNLPRLIAATGASKVLALGLIDAGSSHLEEPSAVARQVEMILKRYVLERVHLLPSCGFHGLPPAVARAKLGGLHRARQLLHLVS